MPRGCRCCALENQKNISSRWEVYGSRRIVLKERWFAILPAVLFEELYSLGAGKLFEFGAFVKKSFAVNLYSVCSLVY